MKLQTCAAIVVLGVGLAASGAVYTEGAYTSGFTLGTGSIPDGNLNGWWDTRNVSGIPAGLTLGGVTVTFTISGGYNGDLYAYLSHNGVLVPLLNRVGTGGGDSFGYATAGFTDVRLSDAGSLNIHNVENPEAYGSPNYTTYLPDGGTLGNITGNPNGNWTIFFADLSSDTLTHSQLTSWSLDITAVPEPVNVALGIFGGVFLVGLGVRSRTVRNRLHRMRVAFVTWVDAV
jgi:hypothetical protein